MIDGEAVQAPGSADVVAEEGNGTTRMVFHGDFDLGGFANKSEERARGIHAAELVYEDQGAVLSVQSSGGSQKGDASFFKWVPLFGRVVCLIVADGDDGSSD